jgi:hypothetical protein
LETSWTRTRWKPESVRREDQVSKNRELHDARHAALETGLTEADANE